MKYLSQGVKAGILLVLLLGGAYVVWKSIGTRSSGERSLELSGLFQDASGLPVGSRVMIAGLPVGEISRLSIEGRYARVAFRIRDDVPIWSNAVVFKKSSSLLGAYYLEVDPGAPQSMGPGGTMLTHVRLVHGDTIERVVEAATVDQIIRRIDESMPNVDRVLVSVRDLSDDLRSMVNGPLASVAARLDEVVQRESHTVTSILASADRTMARIEQITNDIRGSMNGADGRINRILDELEQASREARELMGTAREEIEATGTKVREKLDLVDEALGSSNSVVKKIDDGQGTLGRLVNDPALADNVEEITEDAKEFVKTLTGMQAYVGLRSEYNVFSQLARHYVSVELATRPDKYYYIELEKGPRGNYPEITLEFDPTVNPNQYIRKVRVKDSVRFTFQFAKRINWATFRFGLKESTGGVGFDVNTTWLGRSLRITSDLFDSTWDQMPRLKVTVAYELFRHLYILGGVDEILNTPEELSIDLGNVPSPIQFERFRFGRDMFFGAMLRFNDRDLAALLTVGGSAVAGSLN